MSMEEFYNTAKDADILIYNCSIVEQIHTLDELLDKSPVLKDLRQSKREMLGVQAEACFSRPTKWEASYRR